MRFLGAVGLALCALLAVVSAGAGAAPAKQKPYRNPTAGSALVYQIRGMHRAHVRRNLAYAGRGADARRMDVYRPRRARASARLPAVLLGGSGANGRRSGQKVGWAQLISASGLAAVAFDFREAPAEASADVATAIDYVRANARRLGIDGDRLCTLGFSGGTAPWHLAATMRDPQPYLKCNVVFYGLLDFDDPALAEFSALNYLRQNGARVPPMLIVKAGLDAQVINDTIDRFASAARELHADVRVVTHPTGLHAFDVGSGDARARALIREALRYLRSRLAAPLRLRESCLTESERAAAVRFFASDDTRLVGTLLGSGPAAVALTHESNADLCAWLPYARELAAAGLRVLAYDLRNHGSSQSASGIARNRVDLDAAAAAEALYRAGASRIGLAGGSLGAIASVAGAAEVSQPPAAVVSVSGSDTFGALDLEQSVRRLRSPILFAAAAEDEPFTGSAQRLYAASASADKQLLIAPGVAHGAALLEDPSVHESVTAFIRSRLGFG